VIPNGIDPKEFKLNVDPGRVKERYGIHPLAPVVLFVGRLEYQKGADILLEAIPKVLANRWDVKFVFTGQGAMREYLIWRANELGVSHAVLFLGFVPHWEFLELLNACDIVSLPSRNEPFGIALLEAWAAEKPVVATDVGGLRENIENFKDGVKVYVNPDSVAWGINYLLGEKVKRFSWKESIRKLMGTYSKILGSAE